MTRINLVNPRDLTDQHLIAEYRELPRIFGLAEKHYLAGKKLDVKGSYRLGTGHVVFFYDKIEFLRKRQESLITELLSRGFDIKHTEVTIPDVPREYWQDWEFDQFELSESIGRLQEKLDMKPNFYKLRSSLVDPNHYSNLIT